MTKAWVQNLISRAAAAGGRWQEPLGILGILAGGKVAAAGQDSQPAGPWGTVAPPAAGGIPGRRRGAGAGTACRDCKGCSPRAWLALGSHLLGGWGRGHSTQHHRHLQGRQWAMNR